MRLVLAFLILWITARAVGERDLNFGLELGVTIGAFILAGYTATRRRRHAKAKVLELEADTLRGTAERMLEDDFDVLTLPIGDLALTLESVADDLDDYRRELES